MKVKFTLIEDNVIVYDEKQFGDDYFEIDLDFNNVKYIISTNGDCTGLPCDKCCFYVKHNLGRNIRCSIINYNYGITKISYFKKRLENVKEVSGLNNLDLILKED